MKLKRKLNLNIQYKDTNKNLIIPVLTRWQMSIKIIQEKIKEEGLF